MKEYLEHNEWEIIENGFHLEHNKISESIFSIGNGYMGQRANFEETFTGPSLQGSYISGIYYPDKTRVGWWKNGYPEYFAKVLNSVNWIGINLFINDQLIDLAKVEVLNFKRILNMKDGTLSRAMDFIHDGHKFRIQAERFCSLEIKELGIINYKLKSLDFAGSVKIESSVDCNVVNEDSNYDEIFWESFENKSGQYNTVFATTKKTNFKIAATVEHQISKTVLPTNSYADGKHTDIFNFELTTGEEIVLEKKVVITSSFHHGAVDLKTKGEEILKNIQDQNYSSLVAKHKAIWHSKWENIDIQIEGDIAAQQGIRYNIFQLHQSYSGEDPRLNIGPKGFTGEKYGGSTYWDTEAYCFPFFLSTSSKEVCKNLLLYRYHHLPKAIENAQKLGFSHGAALYPMVTMNGEECHNEWEITFEEIHRNGAIAFAIFDYIRYTGDQEYMLQNGLEVLMAISRFWAQRVNWSNKKEKYVILGVTGPNEYENNVNNNWYTNFLAKWCLEYTLEQIEELSKKDSSSLSELFQRINFDQTKELTQWKDIVEKMYFPKDEELDLYLQQDGFLDKELKSIDQIPNEETPINQFWSWDRILRSCYIKQADVLQGMYFFEDQFSKDEIKKHFEFYEPMTVHESSLSPCVHAVLASSIGRHEKAYEMYLRTARLDLDDYNNDTEDGLHITSMSGSWLSIVKGFGGMRVENDKLRFSPSLPEKWNSYAFRINFRENVIKMQVTSDGLNFENLKGPDIDIQVYNEMVSIPSNSIKQINSTSL